MFFRIFFILNFLVSLSVARDVRSLQYRPLQTFPANKIVRAYFLARDGGNESLPNIVLYDDSMERATTSGQSIFQIPMDYIDYTFSVAGHYAGFLQKLESGSSQQQSELRFSVINHIGKTQSTIHFLHFYDEPFPAFALSDKNGAVVAGQSATGTVWFYDATGHLSKEVDLFPDDEYALERILQIQISENGERVAVLATRRPSSPVDADVSNPSGDPTLFLFNSQGEEIWQRSLPGTDAGSIALSAQGNTIFASSYTSKLNGHVKHSSILFDDTGEKIAEFNLSFRKAHFSSNGERAILIDNRQAALINVSSKQIVWNFKSRKPQIIADAQLSQDGDVAVVLRAQNNFRNGKFIFEEPEIIVLNSKGEMTQSIAIDGTFETPAISLSPDAKYIYLGLQKSLRIFTAE